MSAPVPELLHADIEREITRVFEKNHRSWLFALHGRGEAGQIQANGRSW